MKRILRKNSIFKDITFILILSSLIFPLEAANINRSEVYKKKFDIYLENIDKALQIEDSNSLCIDIKAVLLLMKTRIYDLKRIEPYYDWVSLEKLFSEMKKNYCL